MIENSVVEKIRKWAENEKLVISAHIFGSRARGDHRDDSDLDIALKITKRSGDESQIATWIFEKKRMLNQASKAVPEYKIDLQWIEDKIIKESVDEASILVYEKNESSAT